MNLANVYQIIEDRGLIFTTASYLADLINRGEVSISVVKDGISRYAEVKKVRSVEVDNFRIELFNRIK